MPHLGARRVLALCTLGVTSALLALGQQPLRPQLAVARSPHEAAPARRQAPSPLPRGALELGPAPSQTRLRVQVFFALPHPGALRRFVRAVSTPGSPEYRHYLTPTEFARRFGASAREIAAVRRRLVAGGAHVGRVARNRLSLSATLTAGEVSALFGTRVGEALLPSGRLARDPLGDVVLPSGVSAVVGLSDVARPIPGAIVSHRKPLLAASPGARPAPSGEAQSTPSCPVTQSEPSLFGQSPRAVANLYDFAPLWGLGLNGSGTTIALAEFEGWQPNSVQMFQQCFGTHLTISTTLVDGGLSPAGRALGFQEGDVDLEELAAVAPDAHADFYAGPGTPEGYVDVFDQIVEDDRAKVVSVSWAFGCDAMTGYIGVWEALSEVFQEAAAQGQTLVASSGDWGSSGCSVFIGTLQGLVPAVDEPTASPYVLAVGGTTFTLRDGDLVQATWNGPVGATVYASGGGFSSFWPRPSWQAGAGVGGAWPQTHDCGVSGTDPCREVPDVSALADPSVGYDIVLDDQWDLGGGTSMSAPLWSGLLDLVDEACPAHPVGLVAPALYKAANGPHDPMTPVPLGNNDLFPFREGVLYPAGPGENPATGLGTPIGTALLRDLNPPCPVAQLNRDALALGAPHSLTATSSVTVEDPSDAPLVVQGVAIAGSAATDFAVTTDTCANEPVAPGGGCRIDVEAVGTAGSKQAALVISDDAPGSPQLVALSTSGSGPTPSGGSGAPPSGGPGAPPSGGTGAPPSGGTGAPPPPRPGYWIVGAHGGVYSFGGAHFLGSVPGVLGPGRHLDKPVVGMAATASGKGYWLAAADGGVFAFGDAPYLGSLPAILGARAEHLAAPIVAIAADPQGGGYWLLGADGGVFAFGDAPYLGSLPGLVHAGVLRADPMDARAIVPTPSGQGYWIVGAHGGVYSFGDAAFLGSAARDGAPIVAMAADPQGGGYWLLGADGGVFAFGDAPYLGSLPGLVHAGVLRADPMDARAIVPTPSGQGYWIVGAHGGVYSFGDAAFLGSVPGALRSTARLPDDIVGATSVLPGAAAHAQGAVRLATVPAPGRFLGVRRDLDARPSRGCRASVALTMRRLAPTAGEVAQGHRCSS